MDPRKILTDVEVTDLVKNGKPDAFSILVKRYREPLTVYIRSKLRRNNEDGKDLVQDVFMDAFIAVSRGQYVSGDHFLSWLTGIAHNHLRRYYKSYNRHRIAEFIIEIHDNGEWPAAADYLNRHRLGRALYWLGKISHRYRLVIILHFIKGWSFPEIARRLGVEPGTVSGYCTLAIEKLRQVIKRRE